ncbi:hypothetical protein [Pollutibacter soli]|uniref:hypothetical protein n=1 Tax=Pollutibacter soli TaxID=3034157 RepID=UPI003013EAFA
MSPEKVWLTLIPFFGAVWHFLVVLNISDSIKAEAKSRSLQLDESRPGFNIGTP